MGKLIKWAVALALCAGCGKGQSEVVAPPPPPAADGGNPSIGVDAGPADAGPADAGEPDAGQPDAGQPDAGQPDAGQPDAGTVPDGGTITFGTPGPWPMGNVTYGAADGIQESPVVGVTTDEPISLPGTNAGISQNLWVATRSALYLMMPGESKFRRFDGTTGSADDPKAGGVGDRLHLQTNLVTYCADTNFTDGDKNCRQGAASDPGISEIVGGGPNEVFVGYWGTHNWDDPHDGDWFDIYRHTGKVDRVRIVLKADGTFDKLEVVRFDLVSGNTPQYWHNRSVYRMVYDHFIHPHELFVGTEHGIDKVSPDKWFPPRANWPFGDNLYWMSDHLHPVACKHEWCTGDEGKDTQMMGEWRGLALTPEGDLWVGGKWSAGKIFYAPLNAELKADGTPDPTGKTGWFQRGGEAYKDPKTGASYTFGNQYCGTSGQVANWNGSAWVMGPCPSAGTPPVFQVPMEGDEVSISAVTVTRDGKSWWTSGPLGAYPALGIASFDGRHFSYFDPIRDAGMAETNIRDILALPDGRLVLAGVSTGLVFWNPATGTHVSLRAGQGIPDDNVLRLELDMMVDPPALHVATAGGAVVLRKLPLP